MVLPFTANGKAFKKEYIFDIYFNCFIIGRHAIGVINLYAVYYCLSKTLHLSLVGFSQSHGREVGIAHTTHSATAGAPGNSDSNSHIAILFLNVGIGVRMNNYVHNIASLISNIQV